MQFKNLTINLLSMQSTYDSSCNVCIMRAHCLPAMTLYLRLHAYVQIYDMSEHHVLTLTTSLSCICFESDQENVYILNLWLKCVCSY